jgi:Fungal specific transcription factor domain
LEAYYALGGDASDEPYEFDHEGKTDLHIRLESSSVRQPDYSPNLEFGPLNPPTLRQDIPRSSEVFTSPPKRRKTNDLAPLPLLDKTSDYRDDDVHSLPDQSPAFSFLNLHSPLGPPRRPSSFQGDFDYQGSLLSLTGFSPDTRNALGYGGSPYNIFREKSDFASPTGDVAPPTIPPDPQLQNSTNSSLREAVLMRYFVETLAPWFDLCDPERHFALVVPQRARTCPPLLNAIFTASARHLTRLQKYKRPVGVQWNEHYLPDLNMETTIQYHNKCISNLIELSNDPDQMHNENLLAAASILRWHEEVDAPFRDDMTTEADMFLKV